MTILIKSLTSRSTSTRKCRKFAFTSPLPSSNTLASSTNAGPVAAHKSPKAGEERGCKSEGLPSRSHLPSTRTFFSCTTGKASTAGASAVATTFLQQEIFSRLCLRRERGIKELHNLQTLGLERLARRQNPQG